MPMIELIEMVEKYNTLITINYGTYFVVWIISFRFFNNTCIMPSFGKRTCSSILLRVFKINDTVNFEDNCFVTF